MAFEKRKPQGLFSEFYGIFSFPSSSPWLLKLALDMRQFRWKPDDLMENSPHMHVRQSTKAVLDSGIDYTPWIPVPLSVELGFRIPIVDGIPDSKTQDSEFHKQNFPEFRNPGSLTLESFRF